MSEAGCRRALEVQTTGPISCWRGIAVRFVSLRPAEPDPQRWCANPNTLFWSGGGGSFVLIDTDARMTFAYARTGCSAAWSVTSARSGHRRCGGRSNDALSGGPGLTYD